MVFLNLGFKSFVIRAIDLPLLDLSLIVSSKDNLICECIPSVYKIGHLIRGVIKYYLLFQLPSKMPLIDQRSLSTGLLIFFFRFTKNVLLSFNPKIQKTAKKFFRIKSKLVVIYIFCNI